MSRVPRPAPAVSRGVPPRGGAWETIRSATISEFERAARDEPGDHELAVAQLLELGEDAVDAQRGDEPVNEDVIPLFPL
jgi:hypothetical protein